MKNDRRTFLKQVGGTAAAVLSAGAMVEELTTPASAQDVTGMSIGLAATELGAGRYILELDGAEAGMLASVEGGYASADVVVDNLGPDLAQRKHIGPVKFEDITLECAYGMSNRFYDWLNATLQHKGVHRSGSVIYADSNWKEISRLEFTYALITEIRFPALDAASKDAAKMTVKLAPETTRYNRKGAGQSIPPISTVQKKWISTNFRLQIGGLESATSRVSKIDALVFKQGIVQDAVGEVRDSQSHPGQLETPDLAVTLAQSLADPIASWHEDFVIKGNAGQDKEKTGTLEYLSNDLKTALFTLNFKGLGIFKLAPEKGVSNSESARKVKAEMYSEDVAFTYQSAWK